MTDEPSGRVAGSTLSQGLLGFARIHRRTQTLDRRKVCVARRRLAAGRYDSNELLDAVLERILQDLTL